MSLKAAGGGEINNKSKSLFFENINNTINFYSELSIRKKESVSIRNEDGIFTTVTRGLKGQEGNIMNSFVHINFTA